MFIIQPTTACEAHIYHVRLNVFFSSPDVLKGDCQENLSYLRTCMLKGVCRVRKSYFCKSLGNRVWAPTLKAVTFLLPQIPKSWSLCGPLHITALFCQGQYLANVGPWTKEYKYNNENRISWVQIKSRTGRIQNAMEIMLEKSYLGFWELIERRE